MVRRHISGRSPAPATTGPTILDGSELRRRHPAAISWEDGTILVVGGQCPKGSGKRARLATTYALYDSQHARWEEFAAPFPARIGAGLIRLDSTRALLVGGFARTDNDQDDITQLSYGLDDVWLFEHRAWQPLESCANAHSAPSLVTFRGDVFILDDHPERWDGRTHELVALPPVPDMRERPAVVATDRGVMVHHVGGTVQWSDEHARWLELPRPQVSRSGAQLLAAPEGTLLVGGRYLREVERFDGEAWSVTGLVAPRDDGRVLIVEDKLVAVGGMTSGFRPTHDEWANLDGRSWTPAGEARPPLVHFGAVVAGDRVAIIGGMLQDGSSEIVGVTWISAPWRPSG